MEEFILEFNSCYKVLFMFSFHVDPDLYILFEKLTVQIGVRLGLVPLLLFEAPGDFWVDIVKM